MIDLVEEYYDKCTKYYTLFWSDRKSLAMHYGFWNKDTSTKEEALANQYREIARLLAPQAGEKILDAGCGIGGASIWLAENFPARFTGISISSTQIDLAKKHAQKRHVMDKTEFLKMDFFKTSFQDNSFDKIFAIESFCYSYPGPEKLLRELHRILKKGGQIAISDGFLLRRPEAAGENNYLAKTILGWRLKGASHKDEILASLEKCGFKNIRFVDKRNEIQKNVNKIYYIGMAAYPFLKALYSLRLISKVEFENYYATRYQKKLIDAGIMGYGIFCARK